MSGFGSDDVITRYSCTRTLPFEISLVRPPSRNGSEAMHDLVFDVSLIAAMRTLNSVPGSTDQRTNDRISVLRDDVASEQTTEIPVPYSSLFEDPSTIVKRSMAKTFQVDMDHPGPMHRGAMI